MYSANLIGKQMDTEFGLYLPEYSIPAPEVQTNYKEIPFRDGAIDKTSPDGVVHYKDREWDLTFKKTGATVSASDLAALSMSVMNAIHGKAGEIIFDDDPNYKWVGRVFVTSVNCENNGLMIVNIHMITHPYKYSLADIVVVDEIQTTSDEYEGSIVSLIGGIGKSITELLVSLSPIQDLHGYDHPWPAGGGSNKLGNISGFNNTLYGVTYTVQDDGSVRAVGTVSTHTWNFASFYTSLDTYGLSVGDTISVSVFGSDDINFAIHFYNDSTQIGAISADAVRTAVIPEGTTRLRMLLYCKASAAPNVGEVINKTIYPQLEKATTPSSIFHPYSNICPISGRTGLSVYRTGKNLFDQSDTTYLAQDARYYGSNDNRALAQINTLPAGTYTLSFSEKIVSLNGIEAVPTRFGLYLEATNGGQTFKVNAQSALITPTVGQIITKTVTFTLTDEYVGKFQDFRVYTGENVSHGVPNEYTANIYDVQIELGSATTYEPYNGNTYAVDWTSEAGTVYGGSLDVVTGVLTVDRASVLFDGTQAIGLTNWMPNSSSVGWLYRPSVTPGILNQEIFADTIESSGFISDTLKTVKYGGDTGVYGGTSPCISLVGTTSWGVAMRLNDTTLTTAAKINEYLSANPIRVVYKLATPLTYQLTPQEVALLVGTNNIWSTGDSVSVTLSTMDKVTLVNHGKPMNPKINVVSEGSISILFEIDGARYTAALSAGEYTLPDLVLFDGSTDVYEAGEGTITYTYPEVSL